jgi:ATP-binding cassette subfamily B protein/subfamily B ATP-binding cassette protein MsbA
MNQVIAEAQLNRLCYVILGYIILFIVQSIFLILSKYAENKYTNLLTIDIKQRLLEVYSSMYFMDYEQYNIRDIRLKVESDTSVVCSFYLNHCLNFIFAIISAFIMVIIIFQLNGYLTLFGLLMIVISFFITKVLGEKIKKISKKYRTDQSGFESVIHEALQNWKEIKINNLEEKEEVLLDEKWILLSKSILKRTQYQYLHGALIAVNLFLVTRMNLYFFGGMLIINNLMTVPIMLVFMNYYEQIYSNIQTILDSMVNLNSEAPQIDGILSILKYTNIHDIENSTVNLDNTPFQGNIRIDDISFQYRLSDHYVLNNISAYIKCNHSLAIVGQSGCGKTTLVKLLVGLYMPGRGSIYLDDINLNNVPIELRNHLINIVVQDPMLFNMSILDNLLMAKQNATIEEIDDVCRKANIYDFIQSTAEKYNTMIGEQGIKLSGGQKQRLAIARTLLLNPQVLIFDEATSALDSENESAIVKSIQNLSQYKTIITISHRFSTIFKSDDIIILQKGSVAEQGSLNNILKESKLFESIFREKIILKS